MQFSPKDKYSFIKRALLGPIVNTEDDYLSKTQKLFKYSLNQYGSEMNAKTLF